MGVCGGLATGRCDHVDIRVKGRVAGDTSADFQHLDVTTRPVLQAMPVAVSGREPGRVAGAQDLFAAVSNEDNLAGEDIDELVAARMPMTLARPGAGRQAKQVDAKLR